MQTRVILILLFSFFSIASFSQERKHKRKSRKAEQTVQPTSRDPLPEQEAYAPKASRKHSDGPTYESEQEFYERMAKLEKTRRKAERMMEKPQYSNPMYFGHKHPPKKHKPGKMKYCKVCGIRH